jgi:hypothetical protein
MKLEKVKKKFDNFLRRLTIIRLFYIFIFITFIFTSYLYGLIQIDSHKLVINILPAPDDGNSLKKSVVIDYANFDQKRENRENFLINNDNDYFNEDFKRIIINLNENLNIKEMKINQKEKSDSSSDSIKVYDELKSKIADKNISKLFLTVEKYKRKIKSLLTQNEVKELIIQKQKYQILLLERNRKLREELKKELEANKNNQDFNDENQDLNINNTFYNDTGNVEYDINDILITQLNQDEIINRDIVLKSLRYEKIKLKNKLNYSIKSIKTLIDEFKSKNEFDLK